MTKITVSELKKHILDALEQGLNNKGIADYLNQQFEVPEEQQITSADVAFYKDKVGLKGVKPKKKRFFTIIEEEDETQAEIEASESLPSTEYLEESSQEEKPNNPFNY